MSRMVVELKENNLTIQCKKSRMRPNDTQVVDIRTLFYGRRNVSYVVTHRESELNRILFWKEMDIPALGQMAGKENDKKVLFVITVNGKVLYGYMEAANIYKLMMEFVYKLVSIGLWGKKLRISTLSYLVNQNQDIDIDNVRFYVDEVNQVPVNVKIYKNRISKLKVLFDRNYQKVKIPLEQLLTDDTMNNNMLNMMVCVNGTDVDFRIGKKKRNLENVRKYYAPYKSCYMNHFAIHLRRTDRGNFAIVKRPMEEIEHTLKFRILESRLVSWAMYHLGKMVGKRSKKNVNLFFEKFAQKAEEGAYDLFRIAREQKTSENYFIIDENAPDYEKIKNEKNVVKKYSLKYYWLIYRVNHYIATEAPAHLNILRSNNRYFRLSTCEHPFIFLQHGVTYLKCQGASSTFVKGKEGEPAYIVVGSKKERDAVCDMLKLTEKQVLITGLPVFSKIDYEHINQETPDKVVIMLTWKSYEEHITEFENSQYYKNVMEVYHLLEKYIAPENIIIVPHPKMVELCENTSLSDTMWKKPISEVLSVAKLLITDYSSVCYNSFYQGGGVIFYQPDLALFEAEAGPLIPADDEYIGKRVFDMEHLEEAVSDVIKDGRIQLQEARRPEYVERNGKINEFHDGKNLERIAERLIKLEIM